MLMTAAHRRQQGMALLMAIIVLVALTLGALALTRTVYTSTVIAGNLAFQRSAMLSSDLGVQAATQWLEGARDNVPLNTAKSCGVALQCSLDAEGGYRADRAPDGNGVTSWQTYWKNELDKYAKVVAKIDDAGNKVSYVIQRMCMTPGDPNDPGTKCVISPDDAKRKDGGVDGPKLPPIVYYRITVRVDGARGTVHLAQAMVSM